MKIDLNLGLFFMKKFIINSEYFFQCAGNCSGCFLTDDEKNSSNIYKDNLLKAFTEISKTLGKKEELVIGIGRGNLLNLNYTQIDDLLDFIKWCENIFNYEKITFELSTSLIGKIDQQIQKSLYILKNSPKNNIYFNTVLNSEITSQRFWENVKRFFLANEEYRKSQGLIDDTGDILVLNINPNKLPDLNFFKEFLKNHYSPVNIALFPFELNSANNENMSNLITWTEELFEVLKNKDFNVKNFVNSIANFDSHIEDIFHQYEETKNTYIFVYKTGEITNGGISIMGEVDYIRLKTKYNLTTDIKTAFVKMQKRKSCQQCEHQKECLYSGGYINFLANEKNLDKSICPSSYQKLFQLIKEEH